MFTFRGQSQTLFARRRLCSQNYRATKNRRRGRAYVGELNAPYPMALIGEHSVPHFAVKLRKMALCPRNIQLPGWRDTTCMMLGLKPDSTAKWHGLRAKIGRNDVGIYRMSCPACWLSFLWQCPIGQDVGSASSCLLTRYLHYHICFSYRRI